MMEDECLADMALGNMGDELIIDMQSHFANPESNPLGAPAARALRRPDHAGALSVDRAHARLRATIGGCYDRIEYVDQILMGSDTTIGVLSGISYSLGADGTEGFAVLNNEDLLDGATKLQVDFPDRMLTHAMVMPNDRIDVQLAMMERTAGTYTNWKTYPPWSPAPAAGLLARRHGRPEHGRAADDPAAASTSTRRSSACTRAFRSTASARSTPIRATWARPPTCSRTRVFVIYHSAFEHGLAAGGSTEPSEPAIAGAPCDMTMQRRPAACGPKGRTTTRTPT